MLVASVIIVFALHQSKRQIDSPTSHKSHPNLLIAIPECYKAAFLK
jgi:hypothetical protein